MKRFLTLFTASFLFLNICVSEEYTLIEDQATLPVLTPSLTKRETAKIRLKNGLEAYLISDPNADKSAAALTIQVGSWDEPEEVPGLAHFTEHMLFLGTEKYPVESEYDRFLSEHGGISNAFTQNQATSYLFSVENDAFPEAIDRFASFFREPLFNPSGVARELQAIDQEYAKNLESDGFRELYVHKEMSPKTHPHNRFGMGNLSSLSDVSQETLRQWHGSHYSANLMHLVVYSSLPLDTLKEMIVDDFAAIPNLERTPLDLKDPTFDPQFDQHTIYIEPTKDVRQLTLIWELPQSFAHRLDTQPESIVAHLLGHEGPNSLLASLKKEHWAEGLSAGGGKTGPNQIHFYLQVDLTKEGLNHLNDVIGRCFQAIATLKSQEIPGFLFDEIKKMATIKYQYQPKENEFYSLMKHARLIIEEPLESYPEKSNIIQHFDAEGVQELLEFLTPQKVRFALLAPESQTGIPIENKEQWMGVPYTVKRIPVDLIHKWSRPARSSDTALPEANPFIPNTLTLHADTHQEGIPIPKRIIDSEYGLVYYAPDQLYHVPKVDMNFSIKTPQIALGDSWKVVMADLYVKALKEALNPISYQAKLAELDYDIQREDNGISIHVQGYSENAPLLLDAIVERLNILEIPQEKFKLYKETLLRQYQNFAKETPFRQSIELLRQALYKNYTTERQKAQAIKRVTYKNFQDYQQHLFDKVYIEGVLYGNLTEESAKKQVQKFTQTFQETPPYPIAQQLPKKVLNLPTQEGPFYLEKRIETLGNAAVLAVEIDPFSMENRASQSVLMQAIKQPFFATLRTKQQTGYIVHSSGEEVEQQLFNLFAVQSNTHEPRDLLARFELFIERFLQELTLEEVSTDRFENIVNALKTELEQPPKNLHDMAELLNTLAFQYDGDFQWRAKRIQALEQLDYPTFVAFTKQYLGRQNRQRLGILTKGQLPDQTRFDFLRMKNISELRRISDYVTKNPAQRDVRSENDS